MSDFDAFLESANAEFDSVATKRPDPKYARTRFTCESCGGSGLWRGGRVNQHGNAKCNTCHGRGYLVTSPEARAKGRARAAVAKRFPAHWGHTFFPDLGDHPSTGGSIL
jgi:DnaJ-class molecular chaperone with C-terminal Zn finger domain